MSQHTKLTVTSNVPTLSLAQYAHDGSSSGDDIGKIEYTSADKMVLSAGKVCLGDSKVQIPSDIGAVGTVKRGFLRAKDIIDQVSGNLNYDDVRADLGLIQSQLVSNINK